MQLVYFKCLTLSKKVHIMSGMNKLPVAKRVQILAMLCEGVSMRSISRLVDVALMDAQEDTPKKRGPYKKRVA